MAESGRIQRALEKARRSREKTEPKPVAGSTTATGEHRFMMKSLPVFPEIPYDPVLCTANRIFVPELSFGSRSPAVAAYRVLRTRLLHRTRSNEWTKIGVTSPGQGDGKSVTALNLAISIAREGNNNVFLLDFDMRSPKMCQYLGTPPPIAIDDYLSGSGRPEDCLFSTGIENLSLAGSLTGTENASELLASARIGTFRLHKRGCIPAVDPSRSSPSTHHR